MNFYRFFRRAWPAILLVLGVIALVFGVYEILESLWLERAFPGYLDYFHIARGIGTSLLVGFIIWWFYLREDFFKLGRRALDLTTSRDSSYDLESLALFAQWLVRLRWLAVLFSTIGFYLFGVVSSVIPGWDLTVVLLLLSVLLGLTNVGYALWQHRRTDYRRQLTAQIVGDLVILTLMLHFSGGLENPFFLLYLFHVILASIIFHRLNAFFFTSLSVAFFCLVALGELTGLLAHHTLKLSPQIVTSEIEVHLAQSSYFVVGRVVSFGFILYGTMFFTTMLMRNLRRSREQLVSETNRRRNLLQELFTAQEEERARIGRELHDQIGQQLSALQMQVSRILRNNDYDGTALQDLKTHIEDTIEEVRSLSSQIRPPGLDDCGLPCAIEDHINEVNQQYETDVQFEFIGLRHDENLSETVDIAIYRIVQEALLNVFRHAEADRASVILQHRNDEVQVLIEDDGIGFDLDKLTRGNEREYLGIQGMRERTMNLNGEFAIETQPDHGTQVKVVVPLTDHDDTIRHDRTTKETTG